MIKRNKQGSIVEYENESFREPPREAGPRQDGLVEASTLPATEADIDAEHELAVEKATEEADASLKKEMDVLARQVVSLALVRKEERRAARERCAAVVALVEQAKRVVVEDAEAVCAQETDAINKKFYERMSSVNARVDEVKEVNRLALEAALAACAERRAGRRVALVERRTPSDLKTF